MEEDQACAMATGGGENWLDDLVWEKVYVCVCVCVYVCVCVCVCVCVYVRHLYWRFFLFNIINEIKNH